MIDIVTSLALAGVLGFLLGGRLANLARLRIRWAPAAVVGLALQLAPTPGHTWPLLLLYVSFGLLVVFAFVNVRWRVPGAWLILLGIVCNFTVIAVNEGMPVSREALVRSDQLGTLDLLVEEGAAKHHLATPDDRLRFLGDVIAVGPPVRQAMSVGDVLTYLGVAWLVVAGMRRREEPKRSGSGSLERGERSAPISEEVTSGVG